MIKTLLDVTIGVVLGLLLAGGVAHAQRFTAMNALMTYVGASNALTEVSSANPLPVQGF